MEFFEDGMNFDMEESEEVDKIECYECKAIFEMPAGEEPITCPACGIKFLSEGTC